MSTVPTPPPGLSRAQLADVTLARDAIQRAVSSGFHTVGTEHARELLAAYDALAARTAWLAAQLAEAMDR